MLDGEGILRPGTVAMLRSLHSMGVRIILASGRMTARIIPYAEQLGVPVDLVTYNGSEVLVSGSAGWITLSSRGLEPAARDAVYALSRTHRVFMNIYSQGKLHGYHPEGDFAWSRHYETSSGATYAAKHRRLEDLPTEGIHKLLVIESPEKREALYDAWLPLLTGECVLTKSNPEYLEFLGKDVSKGSGIRIWLEQSGIKASELLAFGDAENDLDMLGLAGLGIAMANATPGVRAAHSRFSRWSNAEEGVAREVASIFNIPP
ncbi:MAG: superfamily hydrolase-like, type 3 [Fibrobacteres bacterium]|nr:superfamily hydrolase-like, type 3 [Fibrobacterota bacterium]